MLGAGEGCWTLNNQRPMIESHLGHHSDTDVESMAVADEPEFEMNWSCDGDNRPGTETNDSLRHLLVRRQQLEVCQAVNVFVIM